MTKDPILLTEGKGRYYVRVLPDYEKCRLDQTNELIDPQATLPWGFKKVYEEKVTSHISFGTQNPNEEHHREAFKKFIQHLLTEATTHGEIEYIFLHILENIHIGTCWQVKGEYQLMIHTNFTKSK